MNEPTTVTPTTTTAAPTTAANTTLTTPVATPTQPASQDWTSGLPDLAKGYVQNKGWKGPEDLVTSYQNLEKNFGVPESQLLKLPKEDAGAEDWGKVWNKLGRPEKPDGYGIKSKDGAANEFQKWASEAFHEAGLTTKQAQAVVAKWDGYIEAQEKAQHAVQAQKVEQEVASLRTEWGPAYDQSVKDAQKAAQTFGVKPEVVDALEKSMGYSETMKFFQKIGAKLGEADYVSGARGDSFNRALTPEAAIAKIEELKQDPTWVKNFLGGGSKEKAEMARLHKFAYSIE